MEDDQNFLLIEEIKSNPVLYNSSHVNYANAATRNKLWEEITAKLNLNISAKHKWKDIRDRYVREKKRIKPRSAAYPPWKCLSKLKWLDEHLRSYTFVTRQPSTKTISKSKKMTKRNKSIKKNNKDNIDINYDLINDINDTNLEISFTSQIDENHATGEIDPFKINLENKCGQIYMENEQLIFVCDLCENIFYEINNFRDHTLNLHQTNENKTKSNSILNIERQDGVEFLESSNSNDTTMNNNIEEYNDDYSTNDFNNIDDQNEETQLSKNNIDYDIDNSINFTESEIEKDICSNADSEIHTEIDIFNLKIPQKIKNENNEYPCPMCNKTYKLYHSLTFHFRNLHANINKCEYCNEIFESATSLKTHLKKIHGIFKRKIGQDDIKNDVVKKIDNNEIPLIPPKILTEDNRFICLVCNNNYSRHESLRKHHNKVHLNNKYIIYECEYCDKIFQTEYLLNLHKPTHSNYRPYKCTKCDADFAHPKFLGIHLRTHLGNRKYSCEYCKETFSKRIDKISHERTNHTKEKPYQCENCLESFTKYSELIVHKNRKHNPNIMKPTFFCNYCNKVFYRKDSHLHHIRKHEGNRPFQCNICMARFVSNSILRSHKKIHKKDS